MHQPKLVPDLFKICVPKLCISINSYSFTDLQIRKNLATSMEQLLTQQKHPKEEKDSHNMMSV